MPANATRSVLIVQLSAIGDVIVASPVANALRDLFPRHRIIWLVHQDLAPLLQGHPNIDVILNLDIDLYTKHWSLARLTHALRQLHALRKHLVAHRIERVFDLQSNLLTGVIACLSGAPHRIGLGNGSGHNWFMTKTISRAVGDDIQIGAQYRYLVNQLGGNDNPWVMHMPKSDAAEAVVEALLRQRVGNEGYCVIAPFTQQPHKNWFDEYWQQIILRIRGRYKLKTVILGGANGQQKGENLERLTGAINFAGKTSLEETTALIRGASLLIGVDTGLTHMGHALKVPTISLFGATSPYTFADSDNSRVIYLNHYCSPCGHKPICRKKYTCMRDITPDIVLTAIKPLMKRNHIIDTHNDT